MSEAMYGLTKSETANFLEGLRLYGQAQFEKGQFEALGEEDAIKAKRIDSELKDYKQYVVNFVAVLAGSKLAKPKKK